jgi:hypothetical protein
MPIPCAQSALLNYSTETQICAAPNQEWTIFRVNLCQQFLLERMECRRAS